LSSLQDLSWIEKTTDECKHTCQGSRKVEQRLLDLEQRVTILENRHARFKIQQFDIDLPFLLYKSYHALKRGSAAASEMSAITERSRSDEGKYLDTFVDMGIARKQRNGRKVMFTLIQKSKD
jgi:hypothetical protein